MPDMIALCHWLESTYIGKHHRTIFLVVPGN